MKNKTLENIGYLSKQDAKSTGYKWKDWYSCLEIINKIQKQKQKKDKLQLGEDISGTSNQ